MEELFEFEVHKKDDVFSESFFQQFVKMFLDKNSLYWGGGGSLTKINGVISTNKGKSVDLNSIINDLVNYFSPQDKIIIRVYESWFDKIDYDTLVIYRNLDLTKTEAGRVEVGSLKTVS